MVPEDQVIFYTMEWERGRDDYGRPVVSNDLSGRMQEYLQQRTW